MSVEVEAFDLEDLKESMEENGIDNLLQVDNTAISSGSAFSSEVILVNKTGETVFWQEIYDGSDGLVSSKIHECEIKYTPGGEPYFEPEGNHQSRRYLKNYLRKNFGEGVE